MSNWLHNDGLGSRSGRMRKDEGVDDFRVSDDFEEIRVLLHEGSRLNLGFFRKQLWIERLRELHESLWMACQLGVYIFGEIL